MTTMTAPVARVRRMRWAALDGWTMTRRELAHWVSQPGQVIIGLLFPVMMVLMFGYLLGGGMAVPDGGDYRAFLMPGMYVMTMAFGIEATYTAITTDTAKGITDRFRSMPMARSAVVVGRAVADMVFSAAGLAVMIACGLAVGWRADNGLGQAAVAVGLLLLLRFSLLWIGIYLGLVLRSPETLMALQILVWPLVFFSNALVGGVTMPGWMAAIVDWNPLSATITATRDLFGNPAWASASWPTDNALLLAVLWPIALIAIFMPLSIRRYHHLNR